MASSGRWTTPSELAEFAYCPRAWYYRTSRPDPGPSSARVDGVRFHRRELASQRRRAEHGPLLGAVVLGGVVLVALGLGLALAGGIP